MDMVQEFFHLDTIICIGRQFMDMVQEFLRLDIIIILCLHFVSGIVGGFLGSAIVEAFRPNPPVVVAAPSPSPTVIVQSPVVVPCQVWIEGKYEDQVVNGILVRKWIPGHWETICH